MSTTALWGHSQFRRIFVSTASFTLGTQIYQLGMPLILYELTKSAVAMTAMRAVELMPNLLHWGRTKAPYMRILRNFINGLILKRWLKFRSVKRTACSAISHLERHSSRG